ncbi:MAG: hypothetical protein LBH44_05215 [Treponema sp.]|jgi:phosphoserine phosphatase|nr:hypothetical protein [Treponema sp.]
MNIALYGISRCGKNYLIDHLLDNINGKVAKTIFHVNGYESLNKLSHNEYGIPLNETNENQKNHLRQMFHDELVALKNGYKHKIVDGHFCFCKNESFEIAFTDKDRDAYDIFFYLDTPANVIIKYANLDANKKDVAFMSEDKIDKWKEFEMQSLRKICLANNKEFVVLDNDIDDCTDFFEEILLETHDILLDSKDIAKHIICKHKELISKYKKIVILDCDRTISNNDTTYDFCASMNIDKNKLKKIFSGEYYSAYQFFRVAKLYAEKDLQLYEYASDHASKTAILNKPLIEDVKHNGDAYLSIGITSGILRTWEKIQEEYKFPNIIVGGSNLETDDFIVSRAVKFYLIKFLRESGKYVIAVGDSMVDMDMLNEADKSFIVAQEKINETIKNYLLNTKTEMMQLEYSELYYEDVPMKRSLFL